MKKNSLGIILRMFQSDSGNQKRGGFTHYVNEDGIESDYHYLFLDLIKKSCSKIELKEVNDIRSLFFTITLKYKKTGC